MVVLSWLQTKPKSRLKTQKTTKNYYFVNYQSPQLEEEGCLTVTMDGSKRTNDITSLYSQ